MRTPWDRPDWLSWRIHADYLIESAAPAGEVKRAVKYALGLYERPKLVLISGMGLWSESSPEMAHAPFSPIWKGRPLLRWVTPRWAHTYFVHANHPIPVAATPADFPGMLDEPFAPILLAFYVKASENVAVRVRNGEISVRRSRSRLFDWIPWDGRVEP